jgi:hypothetical protein
VTTVEYAVTLRGWPIYLEKHHLRGVGGSYIKIPSTDQSDVLPIRYVAD